MAKGFLNISHNFVESDFIICDWVKSTAQGTPVIGFVTGTGLGAQDQTNATEVVYPSPHSNQQLQVLNLPEDWFIVRFWRSSDGIAKDFQLLALAGNARTGALYPITRLEYKVDRGYNNTTPVVTEGVWSDPVMDDQGIRDTRMKDQYYWVEERGTGTFLGAEIVDRSDVGGGFDFVSATKYMESEAVYVVYIVTRVDTAGGDDSGLPSIGDNDVYILEDDEDFDALTMGGKTIIANGSNPILILTFGNLLLQADTKFTVQTHSGLQKFLVLQFDTGDTINFNKEQLNALVLGEGEEVEIVIKDNNFYVTYDNTDYKKQGEVVLSAMPLLNTVKADGESALLADNPRVEMLLNKLDPADIITSDTTWNQSATVDGQTVYPNKGKWMREGANYRPPDLRDKYLKAMPSLADGAGSGAYGHQKLLEHHHNMAGGVDSGGVPYLSWGHSTGGNLGYSLNGSTAAPTAYKTGVPVTLAGATLSSTTQEVNHNKFYVLIRV